MLMVNQMTRTKNAGWDVKQPEKTCEDKNCPFHGSLKTRGKQFTGKVVSDKMQRSIVVEWTGWKYIPKYERYKKKKTKITVHNPPCLNAKEGDLVRICECRPLSKTKNFVVISVIGTLEHYKLDKAAREEGRHKEKAKEIANIQKAATAAPKKKPEPEGGED